MQISYQNSTETTSFRKNLLMSGIKDSSKLIKKSQKCGLIKIDLSENHISASTSDNSKISKPNSVCSEAPEHELKKVNPDVKMLYRLSKIAPSVVSFRSSVARRMAKKLKAQKKRESTKSKLIISIPLLADDN